MGRQEELIQLLLEKKIITNEQSDIIKNIISTERKEIKEVLLENEILNLEEIIELQAKIYNLKYENLSNFKANKKNLDIIPEDVASNYKIICFQKENDLIKIGITDPDNFKAIEAVNFLAKDENYKVEYHLISENSFQKIFKQYKDFKKEIYSAIETREKKEEENKTTSFIEDDYIDINQGEVIKSAPVAKIVSVIIKNAIEGSASDIHIEPSKKESRVRYRIDGILYTSLVLPKKIHSAIVGRIKVLSKLKLDETRLPQDGRIRLKMDNKEIDFRVSTLPLINDEKIVMRILNTNKHAPNLDEIGCSKWMASIIEKNITKTNGMFLVTGPTGSGKSTTLFAILSMLNKDGVNIVTLEDPVEYFIKGVNQSQIKPEIGFTFANGLRSFLRQDPDIIMVGEIRDKETAGLAIHAGLTGHFVLSTLHTTSAIGSIPRLLDMEIEPFLLGSTINMIIAQRLTRRICKHCKKEIKLPLDILSNIESELLDIPESIARQEIENFSEIIANIRDAKFYRGAGCSRCGQSGYSGRLAILEILEINQAIKTLIMESKKNINIQDVKKSQTFITMKQDGIIKSLKGLTTIEEIFRVIQN